MPAPIPSIAHFVWFGQSFPWLNWLAVRSAADRGGYDRVFLYHTDDLSEAEHFQGLVHDPRIGCIRFDFQELLTSIESIAPGIGAVSASLKDPAMKADLARLALLWRYGGAYLDMDTVSIAPLDDLRAVGGFFCGAERLVWPWAVRGSRNPLWLGLAIVRSGVRDLLRCHPSGWRYFRHIERLYPVGPSNAVLGAVPGHLLLGEILNGVTGLSTKRLAASRCAAGTDLLEEVLSRYRGDDVRVLPTEAFFPLGPEISEHWFRLHPRHRSVCPAEVVGPNTRVVHWYASVRAKHIIPIFDAAYVRENRSRQLLSALSAPWVGSEHERG